MTTTKNWFPRVTELARTFHSLERAEGIEPFDAEALWICAQNEHLTPAEHQAAVFILNVWGGPNDRPWPTFDVMEAVSRWDNQNRAAFVAWAKEPWWA